MVYLEQTISVLEKIMSLTAIISHAQEIKFPAHDLRLLSRALDIISRVHAKLYCAHDIIFTRTSANTRL